MADIPLFVDNTTGAPIGFVPYTKKTNNVVLDEVLLKTFVAIADTFIPEMTEEETNAMVQTHATSDEHMEAIRAYCKRKASDTDCIEKCLAILNDPYRVSKSNADDLVFALKLMSTSLGMFALTGYMSPFADLSPHDRDAALNHLLTSNIFTKRMLAHSLRCLVCIVYFASVPLPSAPGIDTSRRNANWAALRYPGPDPAVVAQRNAANREGKETGKDEFQFPTALPMYLFRYSFPDGRARIRKKLLPFSLNRLNEHPRWHLAFHPTVSPLPLRPFLFPAPHDAPFTIPTLRSSTALPPVTLFADIVIIGSGCGGGVAAATLARPGRRVIILEAGGLQHPRDLSLVEEDAFREQYEAGGFLKTLDGSMAVLAGRTAGGGSAVNWACCLDPPLDVRSEWAEQGLPIFETPLFSECVSYAREVMGVHDHPDGHHNGPNAALLSGARRAGMDARALPQNGRGEHACGWCSFGCPHGMKMGSLHGTIPAAQSRGAALIPNCTVQTILHRETPVETPRRSTTTYSLNVNDAQLPLSPSSAASATHLPAPYLSYKAPRTVTGVTATVRVPVSTPADSDARFTKATSVREIPLRVMAPIVITAGGALHSPALLQRSGFQNQHIGQHLRLHPVCGVVARYDAGHGLPDAAHGEKHAARLRQRDAEVGDAGANPTAAAAASSTEETEEDAEATNSTNGVKTTDTAPLSAPAEIRCYEGTQMTSICLNAANTHGDGYGCRVETPAVHPGLSGFAMKWGAVKGYFEEEEEAAGAEASPVHWRSGARFKEQTVGLRRVVPMICIVRDSGEGSVRFNGTSLEISYSINSKDQKSLLQGIRAAIKLHVAGGCTEVAAPQVNLPPLRCGKLGLADPRLERYLDAVEYEGVRACGMGLFSAHQMGTCRLSSCPSRGAARPSGETWDCDGLFVCDASTFPTASGVNPMVTVVAVARMISAFVELRAEMIARSNAAAAM